MTILKYMDIDSKGKPVQRERGLTAEEEAELQRRINEGRVQERAREALQALRYLRANQTVRDFMRADPPTSAQTVAATKELAKGLDLVTELQIKLIRLMLGDFDGTD